ATGYGISSYAGEHAAPGGAEYFDPHDDGTLTHEKPEASADAGAGQGQRQQPQRQANQRQQQQAPQRQQQRQESKPQQQQSQPAQSERADAPGAGSSSSGQQAAAQDGQPDRRKIIASINTLLRETASDAQAFVAWLNVDKLDSASVTVLERGH